MVLLKIRNLNASFTELVIQLFDSLINRNPIIISRILLSLSNFGQKRPSIDYLEIWRDTC